MEVPTGRDVEIAVLAQRHTVGSSVDAQAAAPVEELLAAGGIDVAVSIQIKTPELAVAIRLSAGVVGYEEVLFISRESDAVGSMNLVGQDLGDGSVGIDTINALDGFTSFVKQLHVIARSVAWVGEVDASAGVDNQIVGSVVAFALVVVGQIHDRAVGFGSRDATHTVCRTALARDQPMLVIEGQTIGVIRRGAVNPGGP